MSGFDYFKLALSKYAVFTGRSRRSEYWYFVLFQTIIYGMAILLAIGLAGMESSPVMVLLSTSLIMILSLAFFLPSLAVSVRRLHDIGKSGWFYLVGFVPLVGVILLIVWFCTDSEYGSNQWGPNPKNPESEDDISEHLVDNLS